MVRPKKPETATVIGSGPNGLSAAIVLASAGLATTVFERNPQIGGACSTAETTLPNFHQGLGSSVYPMGVASPFFRSLPIDIPWIEPTAPCAHPLDDGTAVLLEHSLEATVANLDTRDASGYRSLIAPLASRFAELAEDILQPIRHIPRHPLLLARFSTFALRSAVSLARSYFTGKRAQAFFAGMATHSVLSLENSNVSGRWFGSHGGWPREWLANSGGGAQALSDALARHLENLGGYIEINHEVTELPETDLILADITPRQLLRIAGSRLPSRYYRKLERFHYGAGAFEIDYALSAPNALFRPLRSSPFVICYRHGHRSWHQDAIRLFGLLGSRCSILTGVLGARPIHIGQASESITKLSGRSDHEQH